MRAPVLLLAGLLAALLLLPVPATAQASLPPGVTRDLAESQRECRSAGGRPAVTPAYRTSRDLNGDGKPDHLLDLTGLNCEGAGSFFCGSAGCPLTVHMSSPEGYVREALGHVQGWSVETGRDGRAVLVLDLHGGACGRAGAAGCQKRMVWDGRRFVAAGTGASPPPAAAGRPQPAAPPQAAAPSGGWSLREVAGASPVAVVDGPGAVRSLAVLCHQGVPVAAFVLRARPPWPEVKVGLAGRSGQAEVPIRQQPGGGEAWYADLRGSALPRLLAGSDPSLRLTINGGMQGDLSLRGSAQAVRSALGPCQRG